MHAPQMSRPRKSSDVMPDLRPRISQTEGIPSYAQTLWERRVSTKTADVVAAPVVDSFNFDFVQAYEEESEEVSCVSPTHSDRPPRTSSLASGGTGNRSLSLDTDFHRGVNAPVRRPQKGSAWMNRPHPLRAPDLDVIVDLSPVPQPRDRPLPPAPLLASSPPSQANLQKRHRRHMTISESKRNARNTIFVAHPTGLREHDLPPLPGLPGLSPSNSTTASVPSLTPNTPMSLWSPTEDQIRRELEMMTLHDGADPLLNNRYGGQTDPTWIKELEHEVELPPPLALPKRRSPQAPMTAPDQFETPERGQLRRRKSIIEYFRKSPVDRLLDMYLDDDASQAEKKPPDKSQIPDKPGHKRKTSLGRRMTLSFRTSKDKVPEMPPLPTQPARESSRFDFD